MAAPDQQFNLGTAALNGADGDTARAAGTKYNAHVHQTTDVQAALDGAASPDGANVFATVADLDSTPISFTQAVHGFIVGDALYISAANTFAKAQADSVVTAECVGIVTEVVDANNFKLTTGGKITGLAGLTGGTVYFLDAAVAGAFTATEPSSSGQVSKPLFVAINATEALWTNYRGMIVP